MTRKRVKSAASAGELAVTVEQLASTDNRVTFFPVRHHSPACAHQVRELIQATRPAAVLVEGPADFNHRIDELMLDHQLPIAIYSFVRLADGTRCGAWYPFCLYSPEWQALAAAKQMGAEVRFIDLPWADTALLDRTAHRYSDGELRRGRYIATICRELGVDDFDAAWDRLFEIDPHLSTNDFLQRCHHFCLHVRTLQGEASESDRRREAFMADQIRQTLKEVRGSVLVVTGGFHSVALFARLNHLKAFGADQPATFEPSRPRPNENRGIALTPYSYGQLDSLTGYEAGMPNPGFYHQVWLDRWADRQQKGIRTDGFKRRSYQRLLADAVRSLRNHKQIVSTADLIAVEIMAQGLATLRGHAEVWRSDLIDAITGALIKEEREYGCESPFLEAVYTVFRGGRRGQLAEGTQLPPLVTDITGQLKSLGLEPEPRKRDCEIDLHDSQQRATSSVLHRLRILEITGFTRTAGTDFAARPDLARLYEHWSIQWTPTYDARCIEAARYGPSLFDATSARLAERMQHQQRSAEQAALIVLDASLAGIDLLAEEAYELLNLLIRQDGAFLSVVAAMDHLLFLYRYDEVLGTIGNQSIGNLLQESFNRALWLLEGLGQPADDHDRLLLGIRSLVETYQRGGDELMFNGDELCEVLDRVQRDSDQLPAIRGAALGALWVLNRAEAAQVCDTMLQFAQPAKMGDFVGGLFRVAREVVQRHPELVRGIDQVLVAFGNDEFLTALPALRLAFTYFTPREKHHMSVTLLESLGLRDLQPLAALDVTPEQAADTLRFETRLFAEAARYGIRGGINE